jgi:hypothetical protein
MSETAAQWLAVYRASRYGYQLCGRADWRSFALDGEAASGVRESVTLITAWNPHSVEQARAWNLEANRRLRRAIETAALRCSPAFGASLPGVSPAWREEGFALHGLSLSAALEWGRAWGQQALVSLASDGDGLLFCADGVMHRCGLRELSADAL